MRVEQEDLAAFCQASPRLQKAYDLVQEFFSMVREREEHRLDAWLEQVARSGLCELQSFANGVERDKAAVQAGLTWWINNGVVARISDEGQAYQTANVRQSQFRTSSPTGSSCLLTDPSLPSFTESDPPKERPEQR